MPRKARRRILGKRPIVRHEINNIELADLAIELHNLQQRCREEVVDEVTSDGQSDDDNYR